MCYPGGATKTCYRLRHKVHNTLPETEGTVRLQGAAEDNPSAFGVPHSKHARSVYLTLLPAQLRGISSIAGDLKLIQAFVEWYILHVFKSYPIPTRTAALNMVGKQEKMAEARDVFVALSDTHRDATWCAVIILAKGLEMPALLHIACHLDG